MEVSSSPPPFSGIQGRSILDTVTKDSDGTVWALASALWLAVVALGLGGLAYYSSSPGRSADPPAEWTGSPLVTTADTLPKLVMLVHPKCACSRASLGELAVLMARLAGRVDAHVLMARPEGAEAGWEETALWSKASGIPGVTVTLDAGGREAARLGAWTSGDTLLYSSEGKLIFHGGITASRGHEGGNAGRTAIQQLIESGSADRVSTPVFGCPIFSGDSPTDPTVSFSVPRSLEHLPEGGGL